MIPQAEKRRDPPVPDTIWAVPPREALALLGVSDSGLTDAEAAARLRARTTRRPLWARRPPVAVIALISQFRSRPSPLMLAAMLAVVACGVAPVMTPAGKAFGFTAIPAAMFLMLCAIVVAYGAATELAKRRFFARG